MICFYCKESEQKAVGQCLICFRGICRSHTSEVTIPISNNHFLSNITRENYAKVLICGLCTNIESPDIEKDNLAQIPNIEAEVTCKNCGADLRNESRFCSHCGLEIDDQFTESVENTIEMVCPSCKEPLDGDESNCPNCGEDLINIAQRLLTTCVDCGYSHPSLENESICPKCGALLPI